MTPYLSWNFMLSHYSYFLKALNSIVRNYNFYTKFAKLIDTVKLTRCLLEWPSLREQRWRVGRISPVATCSDDWCVALRPPDRLLCASIKVVMSFHHFCPWNFLLVSGQQGLCAACHSKTGTCLSQNSGLVLLLSVEALYQWFQDWMCVSSLNGSAKSRKECHDLSNSITSSVTDSLILS